MVDDTTSLAERRTEEEPEVIERDIAATRERLGRRVDALRFKADVRSRVGEAIAEKREYVRAQARRGGVLLRNNPIAVALAAAAVGVLIGLLLPSKQSGSAWPRRR